jgi:predicted ATP-binding protein involved in virulence
MHLHPKWQRHVIEDLKNTFPNVQFVITTHSPFIVQSLRAEELINLDKGSGEDPFRKGIEDIVEDEMNVDTPRSEKFIEMEEAATEYFNLLEDGGKDTESDLSEVKQRLDELESLFSEDPAYVALLKAERKSKKI